MICLRARCIIAFTALPTNDDSNIKGEEKEEKKCLARYSAYLQSMKSDFSSSSPMSKLARRSFSFMGHAYPSCPARIHLNMVAMYLVSWQRVVFCFSLEEIETGM